MSCRRSFEIDMAAFVHDARGPEWAAFRDHYPLCPDCNVEVRTWTELELALQGAPPATAHPTPLDLLHVSDDAPEIDPSYRRIVEDHLATCRPCADEVATLHAFDFEAFGCRSSEAVATAAIEDLPAEPFANGATFPILEDPLIEEKVAAEPEPAAAAEQEAEPETQTAEAEEVGDPVEPLPPLEPEGVEAVDSIRPFEPVVDEPPPPAFLEPVVIFDPPERRRAPGVGTRLGRLLLHPAFGAFVIAALVAPILWQGRIPDFPFGRAAAPVEIYREVRVSSGIVATRPEPAPAIAAAPAAEPQPADEPMGRVAVATVGDPMAPAEPAPEPAPEAAPDAEAEPPVAAEVAAAADPQPVTRLDAAQPVIVSAREGEDDLLLEIPVPPTVPDGAVLQVTIHGDHEREIVERLPLTDSRAVTVRVAAAWLVPGDYRVELGTVKRGPAPTSVASYSLTVR